MGSEGGRGDRRECFSSLQSPSEQAEAEPPPPPASTMETEEGVAPDNQTAEEKEEEKGQQKPPYSYAQLIVQALLEARDHRQTLSGIYNFIAEKYPFYKLEEKGWKVRQRDGGGRGG